MAAILSSTTLGLFNSSLDLLGGAGPNGNASLGRAGDRIYVNNTTGNLVIQSQDEYLASLGLDTAVVRTYNSQGLLNDDNGDNWRLGVHQSLSDLTGTVNTVGSTITKTFGDGAAIVYRYDAALGVYLSTDGEGAHDTLVFDAVSQTWTWTEGSTRVQETYDGEGRLLSARDVDGNTTTYGYMGNLF